MLLNRKIELCEYALRIYDKVDPGQTTQRMNVMFELHCAKIIELKRRIKNNGNSKTVKHDILVSIIIIFS